MHIAIARRRFDDAPRSRPATSANDARFRAKDAPLSRAQIGGRLSLVDRVPLTIAAEQDLIVYVHIGSVWATQRGDRQSWLARAGECFIADRTGPLVVRAVERAELEVLWPLLSNERLSPGLEPLSIVR
jgi:hypothetical protein